MKKSRTTAASALLWIAATGGCTVRPQTSNTGFEGTWARDGLVKTYRSQVSILRDGERYRFRWKLDSADGTWHVRCDWEGRCEETIDGKKTGEYVFDVRELSPASLRVECTRTPVDKNGSGYRYVDVLDVDPGGTTLSSYTIQLNEETFPKETSPRKILTKVSDTVADPPARVPS